MDIVKQADMGQPLTVEERDLSVINRWSRKALTAEEVYAFAVRLCDNEIDRDGERFTEETLEELAKLFEGKSGIFDHQWSAKGQAARIYRTEVVREENILTRAGDRYCYLKGYAYMVRTEENKDLIAEIDGGIKREVSVGCAVERAACSICGEDIRDRTKCAHVKGREYGGKLCWADLSGATDAYEWSFVAVPAQPRAGVIKRMGGVQEDDLTEYLKDQPVLLTGLMNPQVVRTAEMMDMHCIVFVRGKKVDPNVVALARQKEITVLESPYRMFTACGLLYSNGLRGGCDIK